MGNHLIQTEDKLFLFMKHSFVGMVEIDMSGIIVNLNIQGEAILAPVVSKHDVSSNNFFDILSSVDADLNDKLRVLIEENIKSYSNEVTTLTFSTGHSENEKHYNLRLHKIVQIQ